MDVAKRSTERALVHCRMFHRLLPVASKYKCVGRVRVERVAEVDLTLGAEHAVKVSKARLNPQPSTSRSCP